MNPEQLGKTTIIPEMGRTLHQYTTDDVRRELQFVTQAQSDKGQFIKGIKIRKEDIS